MHEEYPFLRAILNEPDEDSLRLMYADWLEERDDPRAELRLEVQLHSLPKGAKKRKAALQKRLGKLQPALNARWVGRLWRARSLARGMRLDLALLDDGKGLIEVRGGAQETVLLVEGKSVAFNWDDCRGSIGQYLVFTGHTCGSAYLRQLWEFVAGEVNDARPLAEHIKPLLALFVPGLYCLHFAPSSVIEDLSVIEYSGRASADRELGGYYPYGRNLVCTQLRESLNEERVAFYCEQIRARKRPIVLTTAVEDALCEFVIDGHHKLEAYNRQRVTPPILEIVRWGAPSISLEEGISFLPRGHRGIREYRRMKRYAVK